MSATRLPPFQTLLDAYAADVRRLCFSLAAPADADDCVQETWLSALQAYPELRHGRNLRGWLLTIAARAATDSHRARVRRPVPVAELPDRAAAGVPVGDDALWSQVRRLPARQRSALALHYVLDLPHREIAETLGSTPAASRRLVSDALARLRAEMMEPT
ncbi:MAG: sigma-70 family RNA polymerase sigma factor [Actinomycetota bacterium]|nr:sigma-70 family RNA polymerase sigma factor [Actinomycetota bacterium]